jgi:hypothetical protein
MQFPTEPPTLASLFDKNANVSGGALAPLSDSHSQRS